MDLFIYFVKVVGAIFAIVNPVGAATIFVSLSQGRGHDEVRRIPRRTAIAVSAILIVTGFFGHYILAFFGVGIPAFRVGGGILILLISIAMMRARQPRSKYTPREASESAEKEDIAVVPLAIPLMAGPGAISTVIMQTQQASNLAQSATIVAAITLIGVAIYVFFKLGAPLVEKLGRTGINIFTRIMGLMLAAVSIEFITDGLGQLFPALTVVAIH
ncbi:NAAT family transporter [bacterium]|nr:NAAT family transporter [bacterium]